MNAIVYLKRVKRLFSAPYWALRGQLAKFPVWLGDATKALAILVILRPAADWLPRNRAFALARLCGRLHAATPFYGRSKYHAVRRTLANDPAEAKRLTARILSRHFLDFVILRRYLKGRENVKEWPVVESNAQIVDTLRRSNSSYIIALGHFSRHAFIPMYDRRFVPQRVISIIDPPVPRSLDPQKIWLRIHFGQMWQYLKHERPDMRFVSPGNSNLLKTLIRGIKEPGNALFVSVDAPWGRGRSGSIIRPFAGRKTASFATGTARLARMTQCPMVLCIPYLDDRGRVHLDWVRLIEPPDPKDAEADIINTNLLLDDIEHAIGLHPDQYVIDVLRDRRWDVQAQRWDNAAQ